MNITKFAIPEIIFGRGGIVHVAQCAKRLGAKRVLLISDKGVEASGWVEQVMDTLRKNALEWAYFADVDSNPRDFQVDDGFQVYQEAKADVIIAIGGGSPIDAAKGIAILAGNGGLIADYEGANRILRPLPPMVVLPTTAGSGSDISQFCIITDVARQLKMSIISRSLVPNVSIIDPDILLTKSQELIIASAIDAFAHAVESYVSRLASPFTEDQALRAMKLIVANLEPAVEDHSIEALVQLSIASTAAGMSFSNAGLGAGHALAHSLGGMFDILHGLVHPILLPSVMRFNAPVCMDKMAAIGRCIIGRRKCSTEYAAMAGIEKLEEFFAKLGVPVRLREILPQRSSLAQLARAGRGRRLQPDQPPPGRRRKAAGHLRGGLVMRTLPSLEDLVGIEHCKLGFYQELRQSIEELKASHKESEHRRQEIAAILDGITDLMMVLSEDMRILSVNRVFHELLGEEKAEGRFCYEVFRQQTIPCPECPAHRSFRTNTVCKETAIFKIDGRNRQFEMVASPIQNPDKPEKNILIFKRDVTMEKEYQAKFYQAEKMATIGVLAAGVAHEVNNPLAAVSGFAEGIKRRLRKLGSGQDEQNLADIEDYASTILKECKRCQDIVHTLLSFSRPVSVGFSPLSLNFVVNDTLKLLRHKLKKKDPSLHLHLELDQQLPSIYGDEPQLKTGAAQPADQRQRRHRQRRPRRRHLHPHLQSECENGWS